MLGPLSDRSIWLPAELLALPGVDRDEPDESVLGSLTLREDHPDASVEHCVLTCVLYEPPSKSEDVLSERFCGDLCKLQLNVVAAVLSELPDVVRTCSMDGMLATDLSTRVAVFKVGDLNLILDHLLSLVVEAYGVVRLGSRHITHVGAVIVYVRPRSGVVRLDLLISAVTGQQRRLVPAIETLYSVEAVNVPLSIPESISGTAS